MAIQGQERGQERVGTVQGSVGGERRGQGAGGFDGGVEYEDGDRDGGGVVIERLLKEEPVSTRMGMSLLEFVWRRW